MSVPDREAKFADVLNPTISRLSRVERSERLSICRSCEHFTAWERCSICGCFMPLKTGLPHASCPIGKWEKK